MKTTWAQSPAYGLSVLVILAIAALPLPLQASEGDAEAPQLVYAPAAPLHTARDSAIDLQDLRLELRATDAMGLTDKLSLKHSIEGLVDDFLQFHQGESRPGLPDLRERFDGMITWVLDTLSDGGDAMLHGRILASRDALWHTLSDPIAFARQFSALVRKANRAGNDR